MPFYVVGITETSERLGMFSTETQASTYIGTLPNHEKGIYYIDYPCNIVVLPRGIQLSYEKNVNAA